MLEDLEQYPKSLRESVLDLVLSCCILLLKCPATMLFVKLLHLTTPSMLKAAAASAVERCPKNLEKLTLCVGGAQHDQTAPACSLSAA